MAVPSVTGPSVYEQYMIELVNRARENPEAEAILYGIDLNEGLSPGTITSNSKQPLASNQFLTDSANSHSQWMLDTNTFSHTGAGGSSAGDRMGDAGYVFSGSWTWGENIAWRGTTGTPNVTQYIELQHQSLFLSKGHRKNILNDNFREIGIGSVEGRFTTSRTWNAVMTTQNFAKSGSDVFLTGVAFDDEVNNNSFYNVGEGLAGITVEAIRTSDNAIFSTTTMSAGGYNLALNAGTYNVTFSDNSGDYFTETVTIGSENVKLDLDTSETPSNPPSENNAPDFTAQSFSLPENSANSTVIGTVVATDPDGDALTYQITQNLDIDGDGNHAFRLEGNQLIVNDSDDLDYETNPSLPITLQVSDGQLNDSATISINLTNVNELPELVAQSFEIPENSANSTVIGTVVATDPDGDALTYQITQNLDIDGDGNHAFRLEGNQLIVNDSDDLDYETNPSLPITLQVSDGQLSTEALVTINLTDVNENPTPSSPKLHNEILTNIGSQWQTIILPYTYDSMVVVATPNYDSSDLPAVVRIRQAEGNQLEIKVQNPSDTPLSGYNIHLLVIEEGTYTEAQHGFTLEAGLFNSTVTDGKSLGWNGQSISPQNSYQNPVVFGSVMTSNDEDWSSFWSRGNVATNPADGNNIYLGKHIGEDTDTTRLDETLGYVIFEAGTGTIDGQKFSAQLGSDTIVGVDNSQSQYGLSNLDFTPQVALASQSAMDGRDGGWAILSGDNPISSTSLKLQIDEDQIGDSERKHTTEQVSYLLFEEKTGNSNSAPIINPPYVYDVPENSANGTVIGTIVASDPDGDSLTYEITQNIDIDNDGNNAFRLEGNQLIVNDSDDLDYEVDSQLPITIEVSDGQLSTEAPFTINLSDVDENPTPSEIKLHTEVLTNVGSEWQIIDLPYSYDSMVVVATPNYDSSDLPAVVRIRQAQGNQLEIKVQNPSDTPLSGYNIHLLVIEEGTYTEAEHGFTLEAGRFNSTVTNGKSSSSGWNEGQSITPHNSYQNPVVLGSVMTSNDQDWSSFWSRGDVFNNPADGNNIYLGKHIAADTDTARLDETLGYVIFESGTGTIDGQKFSAQLGSDSIEGVDNNSNSQYNLSNLDFTPQIALASQSAMDGGDGGWAILAGDNPISSTSLNLQIDEDQIVDSERKHTTEQVSYLLFEGQTATANSLSINPQGLNDDLLTGTSGMDYFRFDDLSTTYTVIDFNASHGDQLEIDTSVYGLGAGDFSEISLNDANNLLSYNGYDLATLENITNAEFNAHRDVLFI